MTDDDKIVWQKATEGVKPVKTTDHVAVSAPKKIKKRIQKDITPNCRPYRHDLALGTSSDIDKNTMRRFKRGEFGVEALLDLHGLTTDAAYEAVKNFIISCFERQKRAVMIITGKGKIHESDDIFDTKGVLKKSVPEWLRSDMLRPMILSYIHPLPKLGGDGALYILLRRKR
ncbi:MAG: Smr/MutS family protein [Alphaproteobacteria bacterium]|nr:Smr/MutS family protein [Alphaproteobacteria bacterium]